MATPGSESIVLINVFRVAPENQRKLVDLLTRATEESVGRAPGFLSAKLHRSLDGGKVTMYAEWTGIAAYEAMRGNPAAGSALEQALSIATFEPGIYEVVRTFLPSRP
ncbi:MAG: antibiotic biosynthesis monooxygenase family protein [Rhizomicrobium sp.]